MLSLQDIEEARHRIEDAVYKTPCSRVEHFSQAVGAKALYAKLENLQRTGAFKERGALNKLLTLTPEERGRGVITASAGNHAQAVAYHAGRLGIVSTIVMPERTPLIKVTSTRGYGAKVILHGANFDEAYVEARRVQETQRSVFIHPFDDPLVIAGQGTLGLELLEQVPDLEVVVAPIGGGGMVAGLALALKALKPDVRIVGVETAQLPSMKASIEAGRVLKLDAATTLADGIAVRQPGVLSFELTRHGVDEIVTVDEEEIANAILLLLEREKTVVEGAGAVACAALLQGKVPAARGKVTAMVLSGGNIDVTLLSRIIERGLVKDGRQVQLTVCVPDRPGSLAKLTTAIAEQGANVLEIFHNRALSKLALSEVQVDVTLETRGRPHAEEVIAALKQKGWVVEER
jgi:threonine dehydratase